MGVFAYCVNPKTDVQKAQKALNEIFRAHKLDEKYQGDQGRKTVFQPFEVLEAYE